MKTIKRILSIIAVCVGIMPFVHAQNSATEGKEFYVNFTQNYTLVAGSTTVATQIRYVVSDTCYITARYGDGTYLDNNAQYLPGTYTRNVDQYKCYTNSADGTTSNNKFIKITSTENIGVYGLNMYAASTDATTVLPVEALGNHYTLISNTVVTSPASISVIAPTAGTIITIKNAAGTALVTNAAISTGLVYIYTYGSTDITGYTVESNNDICVFVSVAAGTQAVAGAADYNWEQMLPTNTAGKNYLVWSMSASYADVIKLVGLEDNTIVTRKIGAATTNISLNKHTTNSFNTPTSGNSTTYTNNSGGVVELTSNKPFIVEHLLGHAPCIKWISPIEQRVTNSVISPFVPSGSSVITSHQLCIIIPADAESDMRVKEVRGNVETNVVIPFYTNTTNPDYKIAYRTYSQVDDVLIYLNNPGGFLAYMAGYGSAESYIIAAGAGAFDLSAYFTVDGILYQVIDNTTICNTNVRTFEATFWGAATSTPGYLKWYINGVEEIAARDLLTWSKSLAGGTYTVRMDVIDVDAVLHQYTATFKIAVPTSITTHPSTGTIALCGNLSNLTPLSVIAAGTNLTYQWYRNTTASNSGGTLISGATSANYTPPATSASNYYYYCIVTGDCGTETSNLSGIYTMIPSVIPTITIEAITD